MRCDCLNLSAGSSDARGRALHKVLEHAGGWPQRDAFKYILSTHIRLLPLIICYVFFVGDHTNIPSQIMPFGTLALATAGAVDMEGT